MAEKAGQLTVAMKVDAAVLDEVIVLRERAAALEARVYDLEHSHHYVVEEVRSLMEVLRAPQGLLHITATARSVTFAFPQIPGEITFSFDELHLLKSLLAEHGAKERSVR